MNWGASSGRPISSRHGLLELDSSERDNTSLKIRSLRLANSVRPPDSKARFSNRMSPAGIVMFYGAQERETALREVRDTGRADETELTVGSFKTVADLKIIDLTRLPPSPSLFDRDNRAMISGIRFLHRFVEELKQPVIKDGREHVDYVPTQVVTEYFRRAFADVERKPVQGILYPSSVHSGGTCCVLFFEADQCAEEVIFPQFKPRTLQMNFEEGSIERWVWRSTGEFFARK
jgi:RES domain-containing protein